VPMVEGQLGGDEGGASSVIPDPIPPDSARCVFDFVQCSFHLPLNCGHILIEIVYGYERSSPFAPEVSCALRK
jgi:hypothetical protein